MDRKFDRRLTLRHESDLVVARRHVRELGAQQGLSLIEIEALATAVTEIGRNALIHANGGEMRFRGHRRGLEPAARAAVIVSVRDVGPGIGNVEAAMADGFSTGSGLGLGLSGARRLVDVFELESVVGKGTTVRLEKWAATPASR